MSLSGHDHYMLERYFSHGREERSNLGGILDHIERYSHREPRVVDPEVAAATRDHPASCACPDCLRDVTARPTAEVRQHAKDGPDDGLLTLLGRVSRRLSVVRRVDPKSYLVLEAWFGDAGARHAARPNGQGRIGALLVLTETGQALVRARAAKERGAARTKQAVTDEQRLEAVLALSGSNDGFKQLVARARVEAMAMFERSCEAYASTDRAPVPHRALTTRRA